MLTYVWFTGHIRGFVETSYRRPEKKSLAIVIYGNKTFRKVLEFLCAVTSIYSCLDFINSKYAAKF
jgi:hypothetical protein